MAVSRPDTVTVDHHIDSVVVTASRAGHDTPVPHTTLSRAELKGAGASAAIPQSLNLLPSVVSTSEGGTGLGYTALRVRGVSGSQTGVSLNGISLNDAESQEVFWINIPALANYLGSVQLQRGLGTTACGPGAFGASVNMVTDKTMEQSSAEVSYGSFGTFSGSVAARLASKGRFSLAGAYSYQRTDGWIRNAFAGNHSAFATARWEGDSDTVSGLFLFGHQHTGITWEGIPLSVYDAGDLTYNPAGEYIDQSGVVRYYGNQCDNYRQMHSQLQWRHRFSSAMRLETTLNYTDGYGFYEQYRPAFNDGDAVTRDILDNGFWALRSELAWTSDRFSLDAGLYASIYDGAHDGLYVPAAAMVENMVPGTAWDRSGLWYHNDALKDEADAWVRGEWHPARAWTAYGEIQLRAVRHMMDGLDEYGQTLDFDRGWFFANPRLGLSWRPSRSHRLYASAALGHREPGRADLQASASVRQEKLLDFEAAWQYSLDAFRLSAELYAMEYFDMLLETGRLNDAGYAIKENTPRAWRRGVELSASWRPFGQFELSGNISLSTNRIRQYTAYVDCYDDDWTFLGQKQEVYSDVDILLSPSSVGAFSAAWSPSWMSEGFRLTGKYVGPQYWDNTGCPDRRVPGYFVSDLSAGHTFRLTSGSGHGSDSVSGPDSRSLSGAGPSLSLRFDCKNLLGCTYYAYAWVWRARIGESAYQSEGLFPQPPRTFALTLTLTL